MSWLRRRPAQQRPAPQSPTQQPAAAHPDAVPPRAAGPDVPLLEHDDDPIDVITPSIDHGRIRFPERAVFAWLDDTTTQRAAQDGYAETDTVQLVGLRVPIWVGRHAETDVTLVEMPVGAPAAAIVADHLFRHGVRVAIGTGSCGGLRAFDEGEFIVVTRALRDEGTSYHYAPPARFVDLDESCVDACAAAVEAAGLAVARETTWTTDGLYRETRAVIDRRSADGCAVVEMECAALAAVARFRGARYGQLLHTADTLSGRYSRRGYGKAARPMALDLALDAVTRVAL